MSPFLGILGAEPLRSGRDGASSAAQWLLLAADMKTVPPILGMFVALMLACSSATTTVDAAGDVLEEVDADLPDGGPCTGTGPQCVGGTPGGNCGDAYFPSQCQQGQWRCPTGMIDTAQCGCFSAGPMCHTALAGGACLNTTAQPSCGGGSWTCPEGTIPENQCVCIVRPGAPPPCSE